MSKISRGEQLVFRLVLKGILTSSSWVETIDISEQGCKEAVEKVYNGKARYRVTLVGYDKVFGDRA